MATGFQVEQKGMPNAQALFMPLLFLYLLVSQWPNKSLSREEIDTSANEKSHNVTL
jgi:hypothetical protein